MRLEQGSQEKNLRNIKLERGETSGKNHRLGHGGLQEKSGAARKEEELAQEAIQFRSEQPKALGGYKATKHIEGLFISQKKKKVRGIYPKMLVRKSMPSEGWSMGLSRFRKTKTTQGLQAAVESEKERIWVVRVQLL